MKTNLLNLTELAAALGRHHQQVSRESRLPGFPVHVVGCRRKFVLAEVVEYRDQFRQRLPSVAAVAMVPDPQDEAFLECIRVKLSDVTTDAPPFHVRSSLGPELFAEQNIDDLESLAAHFTYALAIGAAGVKALAPQAYYDDLFARIPAGSMENSLALCFFCWLARRYVNQTGWWKRLPKPLEAPPVEAVKGVEPLEHRKTKGVRHG
jgi:hypothetical protein